MPGSVEEREVGQAAVWSLSTAKPGNGVEQLRDDNIDTYWQSDGPQPHLINIQFHKKMRIHEIVIYTDFKLDESYTPSKISIRVGSTFHDLQVAVSCALHIHLHTLRAEHCAMPHAGNPRGGVE
jgi:anaphase-promoting complex subunit 10